MAINNSKQQNKMIPQKGEMMTHNCESGLNYDQLDNVIAIPSKLPSELYLYRENYSQIDRPQSFSFSHIKLILTAHRKLSQLWTRLYFLEYRYSVKILLKNTSELFTQCTADAFAIHVSAFLFTFVKYLRIFAITSTLYRLWQERRYM